MRVELVGRTWRPFSWNVSNIDQRLVIRCGKFDSSSSDSFRCHRWLRALASLPIRKTHHMPSTVQTRSTRPSGTNRPPNFVEFVQSSLSVIATAMTAADVIRLSGPESRISTHLDCRRLRWRYGRPRKISAGPASLDGPPTGNGC